MHFRRNLSNTTTCQHFLEEEETILHCLHECRKARHIWHMMGKDDDHLFTSDTVLWLHGLANRDDSNMMCATLWWVWRCRNAEVLGDDPLQPFTVVRNIQLDVLVLNDGWISDP